MNVRSIPAKLFVHGAWAWALALAGGLTPQEPAQPKPPEQAPSAAPSAEDPDPLDPVRELQAMPRPQALALPREEHITVDGVLVDWERKLPVILLDDFRLLSGTALGAWSGIDDLSARAFVQWDDDDLYIAVVVRDDYHRPLGPHDGPPREVPPADAVVITFDAGRDTRSLGPDLQRADDREFWLGDVPESKRQLVVWDRYRGTVRFADRGASRVKRDDEHGTTAYEARLPWSEILPVGQKPEAGLVVDMQIVVNDLDDPQDLLPQTRIGWTFGMGRSIDPGVLGALMLVDELDPSSEFMPEFPERPEVRSSVPDVTYQADLIERLGKTEPVVFSADQGLPQTMGGITRQRVLEDIEEQCAKMPRLDYLEFNHRMHRRMSRESSGACRRGLPAYWLLATMDMVQRVKDDPPASGFRLFRLPQGGWFVRSAQANFAIDPAGPELATRLGPGCDFVLLTQPLNDTKRSDQLLVRLLAMERPRPVFTHVQLPMPGVPGERLRPIELGARYEIAGIAIEALGSSADPSRVPLSASYVLTWPDGTRLVVGSPQLVEESVPRDRPVNALILSAYHPYFKAVGIRLDAGVTILDQVFECSAVVGASTSRVSLETAWDLQKALGEKPSLLIGPGESWDIGPK